MKFSLFNNRINLSENTDILFNAFSEKSIVIRKCDNLDIERLSKDDIKIYFDNGILVPDDVDEIEKVKVIFNSSTRNNDYFKLTINPTLNCNFRCWYCYETHQAKSLMSESMISRVKCCIDEISHKYAMMELAFFGGEPLLEFNRVVKPLLDYTHQISLKTGLKYQATFTTNGFLINDDIVSELKNYSVGISQITLDGGPDDHNKTRSNKHKDSFVTIVNNIKMMVKAELPVLVRINVTKDNVLRAAEVHQYFKDLSDNEKRYLNVLIQQVWQDVENDILDEIWDVYEDFHKIGIKPWPRKFNFIKDICYADRLHSAVINYDGKVYKCTAMDFNAKHSDGELSENGILNIGQAYDERMQKRTNNTLCNICRILPLCNGGCCKNVIQAKDKTNYCLHPSDEDKDKVVLKAIREQLRMTELGLL